MTKQCSKCNKIKLLELFHQQLARWTTKDGIKHKTKFFTNICKTCNKEYNRNYRKKNISRLNKAQRIIYWKNHEKTLKDRAVFRDNHRQAVIDYQEKYYQENKEKMIQNTKKWVKNNPEKKKEACKKYNCKPEIKLKNSLKAKKASKNLEDDYVKDVIVKRSFLNRSDISNEMVKLKRIDLQLKRILKNK